jgi:chromosome segregation ATPase
MSEVAERDPTQPAPPPTRVSVAIAAQRARFAPPDVLPLPEVPDTGLVPAARYVVTFVRARWQRRGAIRMLEAETRDETTALDGVLAALGKQVRALDIDGPALAAENAAITEALRRRDDSERQSVELTGRLRDEHVKFAEISEEREAKVRDAEQARAKAQRELDELEGARRSLRERRKQVERQQRGYVKSAEDREQQAAKSPPGDARDALRRSAEELRRDAAGLDPERQELERRLGALERPLSQATARLVALEQELESARRSLHDAREGHRHRLAELEAEQGRKGRELALADAEIQRRMVTLGTLLNLERVEHPALSPLYEQVDALRGGIAQRAAEIERMTAERLAWDRPAALRGVAVLAGGVVALLTLIVVLFALL